MSDERVMIGLDLSLASMSVLEILCDEASEETIFRDIYRANIARPEVLRMLYDHPALPGDLMQEIAPALQLPVMTRERPLQDRKTAAAKGEEVERTEAGKKESLVRKIQKLTVGERVHLAMKAGKEVRSVLMKDSSKEVVKKVLENPRLTDSEVELITKSRSATEDTMRFICRKKEWMKNYSIMSGVITNPKTPGGLAMQFVKRLKKRDLALLEKNKNVSEAVRVTAKKLLKAKSS